jgi:hypothetical protein
MRAQAAPLLRVVRLSTLVLAVCGYAFAQNATLSLSSGSAAPGATVPLNISLAGTGTLPVSTEWNLSFSTTDFSEVNVTSAATNKSISCQYGTGTATCMLWGLNDTPMASGVVATVSLTVSASTKDTSSLVQLTNGISASSTATADSTLTTNGTVTILQTPSLNGFSCNSTSISPAAGTTCTVQLTLAAGSGGTTISLSSSPTDVTMQSTVTVPQNSTSTTFPVTAGSAAVPTPVTLTASLAGVNETFGLTVNPPAVALSSVSVSPGTIVSAQSGTGTVTLTAAAPLGGTVVSLSSSNTSAATVPASVTVPQGQTSATFTVTAGTVSTSTPVTLTATYSSVNATFGLTVSAPSAIGLSVSPGAGSGLTRTFTLTFNDSNGYADLAVLDVLIYNYLDGIGACYAAVVPSGASSGYLYLVDNAGDGGYVSGSPMSLPSSSTLQNGQCTINGAGSSVSASGNTLTLTLAVTFSSGFSGNKIVYMAARSSSQNSGWQPMGTWNVPGAALTGPAVAGMTPARSSTTGQTYSFTFTDTNGYADLAVVDVLINNSLDGIAACYVAFAPTSATSGQLYLVDDAGDGGYASGSPIALPSSSTLSNSQCTISGPGSSVTATGNTLTLNLAITFSSTLAGNQVFYLAARNNSSGNSGWQAVGSLTVP